MEEPGFEFKSCAAFPLEVLAIPEVPGSSVARCLGPSLPAHPTGSRAQWKRVRPPWTLHGIISTLTVERRRSKERGGSTRRREPLLHRVSPYPAVCRRRFFNRLNLFLRRGGTRSLSLSIERGRRATARQIAGVGGAAPQACWARERDSPLPAPRFPFPSIRSAAGTGLLHSQRPSPCSQDPAKASGSGAAGQMGTRRRVPSSLRSPSGNPESRLLPVSRKVTSPGAAQTGRDPGR